MKCDDCGTELAEINDPRYAQKYCPKCHTTWVKKGADSEAPKVQPKKNPQKRFTLDVTQEGMDLCINGTNTGFTPLELLGLLEWKQKDILRQMRGEIKPDRVTRTYVEEPDELPTRPV